MSGPIAPTYCSGTNGSVSVTLVSTAVFVTMTDWQTAEEAATWDATNATTQGYEWPEAATNKCTGSFNAVYKRINGSTVTAGVPAIKKGKVYPVAFNTQPTGASTFEGYSGNFLVMSVSTTQTVKGETKYAVSGQFQGVYDSPMYPTARADAIATPPTGDFTPPADPS